MKDSEVACITSTHPLKLWSCLISFYFSGERLSGTNLHSLQFSTSLTAWQCPLAQRWLVGVGLETRFFLYTLSANRAGAMF